MIGRSKPTGRRLAIRTILCILAAVLVVTGGTTAWALNRYVVDHVKVADVAALEAAASSTSLSGGPTETGAPAPTTRAPVATSAPLATGAAPTTTRPSEPQIDIQTVTTGSGDDTITYFVADVVLPDATALRSGFAENKFGENIIANTSTIAAENGAIFAINGDYYGYRRSGILIRNGVIYRDDGARQGLALYRDGSMALYDETTTTAEQLVAAGVWNTLSFGPGIVDNGAVLPGIEDVEIDTNIGNHSIQGDQPRTGLGMVAPNHFVFVVVDGRSRGYSRGVTMTEFGEIFVGLGARVAYNLDGGGSATMVNQGELVNNPLGKGQERGTSDILYIAGPTEAEQ